jgi:RNA polymerase sigma factor (sigma-70 family)
MEAMDDDRLISRAAAGDADAWSALVRRYDRYVLTVVRACRVPESDVPDAVQFVFIQLFQYLSTLREGVKLSAWLRQTAVRHAVKTRKKLSAGAVSADDSWLEAIADGTTPDDAVMASEREILVRRAMEGLNPRCQQLVRQLFFEDPPRPYAEVAAELGIAANSLAMTRKRCLEALERGLRARGLP